VVADVSARWSLDVGAAFVPGGTAAWVAPARRADGTHVVLKLAWRHYEADHEADGLRVWDGDGAVRLIVSEHIDERTDALLLERCLPGTAATTLPENEQDELVAKLLRRLWIAPPPGPFRPLHSMCDAWAAGLDTERAAAVLGDPGLVRDGVALFRDLPRDWRGPDVLLSTDLHAGNILAAQREPWLVIDPKPYVGDPTYDALQHQLNCQERLARDPKRLIERIAGLLELDGERLTRWLFARCVIECVEQPHLAEVARAVA
jgi:streptomycin 6-kinase